MIKRLFTLASLALLAIVPSCHNNSSGGNYPVEYDPYREEVVYVNNDIQQINSYTYENGLRTSSHSKKYKNLKILSETFTSTEYKNKQPVRTAESFIDYADNSVNSSFTQTATSYDSHGNLINLLSTSNNSIGEITVSSVACGYKYDNRGNILEEILAASNYNGFANNRYLYLTIYKNIYTYDKNNRLVDALNYVLNEEEEFRIQASAHYYYGDKLIESTLCEYDPNQKIISKGLISEKFDNDNNVIETTQYAYKVHNSKRNKLTYTINEYGSNHCCLHSTTYSYSDTGKESLEKDVRTTYLNNNPNRIVNQSTFASSKGKTMMTVLSNYYDNNNRIIKSVTLGGSTKGSEVRVYKY